MRESRDAPHNDICSSSVGWRIVVDKADSPTGERIRTQVVGIGARAGSQIVNRKCSLAGTLSSRSSSHTLQNLFCRGEA